MSTPRTRPVDHMPLKEGIAPRATAGGSALSLTCTLTSAAEFLVVTNRQHPVNAGSPIRVIELDAPSQLVESEVAAHLPVALERARVVAKQTLQAEGMTIQKRLAFAYQDVIEAWALGLTIRIARGLLIDLCDHSVFAHLTLSPAIRVTHSSAPKPLYKTRHPPRTIPGHHLWQGIIEIGTTLLILLVAGPSLLISHPFLGQLVRFFSASHHAVSQEQEKSTHPDHDVRRLQPWPSHSYIAKLSGKLSQASRRAAGADQPAPENKTA